MKTFKQFLKESEEKQEINENFSDKDIKEYEKKLQDIAKTYTMCERNIKNLLDDMHRKFSINTTKEDKEIEKNFTKYEDAVSKLMMSLWTLHSKTNTNKI